jgi:hypothetical protein
VVKNIKQNNMAFNLKLQSPIKQDKKPYGVSSVPSSKEIASIRKQQDYNRNNKSIASVLDITGASNYKDANLAERDLRGMISNPKVKWDTSRALGDVIDMVSAIPIVGRVSTGFQLAKKAPSLISKAIPLAKGIAGNVFADETSKKISEKKEVEPTAPKSGIKSNKSGQTPMRQEMIKRKDGSYSERGLWDNIRANKGSGKKPTKAMLSEAKKITKKKK